MPFRSFETHSTGGAFWKRAMWRAESRARRLARGLRSDGRLVSESFDPEDVNVLGKVANEAFASIESALPIGSLERSRKILSFIEDGFPTSLLTEAYFANLDAMLAGRAPLLTSGTLVIGVGTGRSGSTSLAARLGEVKDSCSTHENPPLVFWRPRAEQVSFHLRRFKTLLRYHPLVADCAHWWINLVDDLVREIPDVRFVGTLRDRYDCAVSFARIKGFGQGSYNHWAGRPTQLWASALWDPTYPKFEIPKWAASDPDRAKWGMIVDYIDLYNAKMRNMAIKYPAKFMILRTEMLDSAELVARLFAFIGAAKVAKDEPIKLNVRSTEQGQMEYFKV